MQMQDALKIECKTQVILNPMISLGYEQDQLVLIGKIIYVN
jgi:hypothetical protein